MFNRPIHIGLSPNTSIDDYLLALKLLHQPWKWKRGKAPAKIEQWFKDNFKVDTAVSFVSGRTALLAILKSLGIPKGSEVLCQAFTCVAVPNSIIWAGLKPVFIDIDQTLNIDIQDAEKKLTVQTKALIVQHTFGIPADMEKITTFCKKHNLTLIEDCCHALGATYKGKLLGTFGDAAFFSFGRDKVVSGVFGGVAILNAKNKKQKIELFNFYNQLLFPSRFWIFQQLLHAVLMMVILPLYNTFNIGKVILFIAQKFRLLSFPVYPDEKQNKLPEIFLKKFPNALAVLTLAQLGKLDKFNQKRKHIAQKYFSRIKNPEIILPKMSSDGFYLRFNTLTKKANEIRFTAKKRGIILGDWYHNIIDPEEVDLVRTGYKLGSCPNAEKAAKECLNLPTYPGLNEEQVDQIILLLNNIIIS